jgi:hypothetical protein
METDPTPTSTPEPAPSRDGRDPSNRMRVLAASAAVAALTAAVGLNAIVLTQGQGAAGTSAGTAVDPLASAAPQASLAAGDAGTAPAATAPTTTTPQGGIAPQLGGQPPQRGQGPGHATSGGS